MIKSNYYEIDIIDLKLVLFIIKKIIFEKRNLAKVELMDGNPIKRTRLNVLFQLQTSQAHSTRNKTHLQRVLYKNNFTYPVKMYGLS